MTISGIDRTLAQRSPSHPPHLSCLYNDEVLRRRVRAILEHHLLRPQVDAETALEDDSMIGSATAQHGSLEGA